jgi:TolB-like protein/tetratricopeptide (TPR) repeat protein
MGDGKWTMVEGMADGGGTDRGGAVPLATQDFRAGSEAAPVFISYASPDLAAADAVVGALERAGLRCWIAPRDVVPGALYADEIIRGINEARVIVLVLSGQAVISPHVGKEIERASSKGRPIVTLRTDATQLTGAFEYFLSQSQWIDVGSGGIEVAAGKVMEAIRRHLDPATAVAAPRPGSQQHAGGRAATARAKWLVGSVAVVGFALACVVAANLFGTHHGTDAAAGAAGTAAVPATPVVSERSVAVLPFADTSEKKDQEYFSDGLSEELIDLLGRVPGLHVPARTSSFYFKGKQATLAEIAKALGVSHVLEGSVRKSGQQLRVTAELVRVADDTRIWSETFDRKLDDVFKVQDDIAGAVVKALKISLLAGQQVYATPTTNSEAYASYLRGKAIMRGGTEEDFNQAQSFFERAVAVDPAFAPGWAAIGDLRADLYGSFRVPRRYQEVAGPAHAEASRALALDPNLPDAHLALGRIAFLIDLDWDTATRELSRTVELAPGNAMAWRFRSYLAGTLGDDAQQRTFAERAIASDPLDYWNYFAAGLAGYTSGRLAEGEELFRRAIALNDRAGAVHATFARLLIMSGKTREALEEVRRETAPAWRALAEPLALDALGRRQEADVLLARGEALYGDAYASQIALIYATRNDPDNAIKWLERSYRQHDSTPIFLRHDPMLKSLSGNPAYRAYLRKMNLPE